MDQSTPPDLQKFLKNLHEPPKQICYLASPYWHANPAVRAARYQAALQTTRHLIVNGQVAYSPIVYTATLQEGTRHSPPMGWYAFDLHFLQAADNLMILELPGWEMSRGVLLECAYARARGIPIIRMSWEEIEAFLDPAISHAVRTQDELPADP